MSVLLVIYHLDVGFRDFVALASMDCSDNPEETSAVGSAGVCLAQCGRKDWCGWFSLEQSVYYKEDVQMCRLYKECSEKVPDKGYTLYSRIGFR